MEVTNIQGPQDNESVVYAFARWFAVWLVIYGVMGFYGGMFASTPKDLPAGMTWENAQDVSSSTFYIFRDGPHLILESNPHSQKWMMLLFTGFAVAMMYVVGQGLQGKLRNKRKELLPPWQQWFGVVAGAAAVVFMLWWGVGSLMEKQLLDLDPAADTVTLDGHQLGAFRQVGGFRFYITYGSKGSTNYHLDMELAGTPGIRLGGANAHSDVEQTASYLNSYLADARRAVP